MREVSRDVGVHLDRHRHSQGGYRESWRHPGHLRRGRGRLAGVRDLVARGLQSGVALVTSDAHAGLVARSAPPARSGLAALQNPLRSQSDGSHPEALLAVGAHTALHLRPARRRISLLPNMIDALTDKLPRGGRAPRHRPRLLLAFTASPKRSGAKSGPTTPGTPQPRGTTPNRRRGHLPSRASIIRLVGAVLAEQRRMDRRTAPGPRGPHPGPALTSRNPPSSRATNTPADHPRLPAKDHAANLHCTTSLALARLASRAAARVRR